MPPSSDALLLNRLRRADPDRYFCTLFAPPPARATLALLYLFNHELARAREVASEPLLAMIRLQWWREVVEGTPRQHELATPLGAALAARRFARADLLALIAAREVEAAPDIPDLPAFLAYARGTGGGLARVAGRVLGVESQEIEDVGTAYAITGILRAAPYLASQGRSLLPADGTDQADMIAQARRCLNVRIPRAGLAASLPGALARVDLAAPGATMLRRRLAVLRAALTGRV